MSAKTIWTPSAKTISKKAETRYKKQLAAAEDKGKRLEDRHKRLAKEIVEAALEVERIKKSGVQLTDAEKKSKSKEDAKLALIISLHDKKHLSFAEIGKKLKISHAWAHALYASSPDAKKPAAAKAVKRKVKAAKAANKKVKAAKIASKKKVVAKPAKKAKTPKAKSVKSKAAAPAPKVPEAKELSGVTEGSKWSGSNVQ